MVSSLSLLFFLPYILDSMLEKSANPETSTIFKKVPRKNFLFVSFCFVWGWECFYGLFVFLAKMTKKGAAGEKIFLIVTTVYFWIPSTKAKSKAWISHPHPLVMRYTLHYWGGSKETKSLSLCFKHWPEGMRFLLHPQPPPPPHHVTGNQWHTWGAWTSTLT